MNLTSLVTDSRKLIYILGGAIAVMVFVTIVFIIGNFNKGSTSGDVELVVWGVFDDRTAFDQAIEDFEKAHSGVTIKYQVFPFAQYEQAVVNALASGQGPDVWMIHNTWLPEHIAKLQPMPQTFPSTGAPLMTVRQFQSAFVDVAYNDLVNDGKIYAMPLYVDTLALYYNKDLFSSAGIAQPPATWTDFQADVKLLTKLDASHNITKSAAAMGASRNINRSTDILMMLMLQSGVQMTNQANDQATFSRSVDGQPVGERALTFYTDFTNPQKEVYTWNDNQHYSVDAFVAGETAMMLNYSHQVAAVRQAAARLNFAVAPVPQATQADARTFANYWALATTLASKHPYEAWEFVHYLTADAGNVAYLNATRRPAGRRDLIVQQQSDPDLGVFAEQALTARSWFQLDSQGIETIFANMIDSVNLGRQSVKDALKDAESKVTVLMGK